MILIADSGSTKAEWCIAHKGVLIRQVFTAGINPYFQNRDDIDREIRQNLLPFIKGIPIEAVFFYGAGVLPEKKQIITDTLSSLLKVPAEAESDLFGAARALFGKESGITCILGTGSNSCLYNGTEIVKNVSPLGFILGDEGSGAVLGKLLVGDCLKKQLPTHLIDKFLQQFQLSPATILEHVYRQPFPNRYLASLSRFLLENISEPDIYKLVYNSFRSFFIRNVMLYEGYAEYPVAFTGSIAFHYRQVLIDAAESLSIQISRIERTPMPGLLRYHA
ncbi:N-acetylglucosamine kinase-like BadF-type ATPase [Parabacteroides sp. PF5-5]|uniref:ATPase n=1 Tax=unclassified Parabacteroides TaxID=2649774 RepID=UPI0024732226|nr:MULTISPECIES: ATPase [unclassified Parabacteroides]MDH6306651.1 N-acetylglucosamine kinase-like BadF-type ATPase [Parabacteroides sp. PH5-39]MDH6317618.1 N-acetylglucosamine kinase-like BadF-type ATPase [Parabacteroides sp. PF5-13]MDH6321362.1 N-acetylglucosamine kinase-like BadF-type ATPase [Parabacteroides sp. PH5-13]MDH6325073.1 N-acetylglucosamine kinase-like BadF-type ATPase [Parabacteroides sp. PH5-8]MDH6328782.1 N-acetylglucosamine kinase-like BadF-type ATPase [Parabacteroides sp. PH